jgi:hypothetical protein
VRVPGPGVSVPIGGVTPPGGCTPPGGNVGIMPVGGSVGTPGVRVPGPGVSVPIGGTAPPGDPGPPGRVGRVGMSPLGGRFTIGGRLGLGPPP